MVTSRQLYYCAKDKFKEPLPLLTALGKDAKWLSHTNAAANTHIHTQSYCDNRLNAWG